MSMDIVDYKRNYFISGRYKAISKVEINVLWRLGFHIYDLGEINPAIPGKPHTLSADISK